MADAIWKCLEPEKLAIDPSTETAEDDWKFWLKTFTNFVEAMPQSEQELNRLTLLTVYLTARTYKLIANETTYDGAINTLRNIYVKPRNEIAPRHVLPTLQQQQGDNPLMSLLRLYLSKPQFHKHNRNFTNITAQKYRDTLRRDAFVQETLSNFMRWRFIQSPTLKAGLHDQLS